MEMSERGSRIRRLIERIEDLLVQEMKMLRAAGDNRHDQLATIMSAVSLIVGRSLGDCVMEEHPDGTDEDRDFTLMSHIETLRRIVFREAQEAITENVTTVVLSPDLN
jgi:hypothetical protein